MVRVLAGQGAREDVEELTADVFLALWAHAGELNPEQGLRPWLGTVARNRAADWLRTHKEAAPLPEDAAAPGGADPQAEAERREWAARLWDAVEGLDEPDRTLFLRYYYYGDKLKDIARALGLTQTAAKQRLFRGRKALRDTLTKGRVLSPGDNRLCDGGDHREVHICHPHGDYIKAFLWPCGRNDMGTHIVIGRCILSAAVQYAGEIILHFVILLRLFYDRCQSKLRPSILQSGQYRKSCRE